MSRADIILLAIAAYVAVMTLVRLMKRRRDELVADVQRQVDAHRKRRSETRTQHSDERDSGRSRSLARRPCSPPRLRFSSHETLHRNRRLPDERAR